MIDGADLYELVIDDESIVLINNPNIWLWVFDKDGRYEKSNILRKQEIEAKSLKD